jgi:predicted nucleic acid-binding protein
MKPTVYVDTTIPSYYVDQRETLRLHIDRTRHWWDTERPQYQVFVSDLVVLELQEGDYPSKSDALALVASIPRLAPAPAVGEIVAAYLTHRLMPRQDLRDAFHLAFASFYKVDFLLTWNCQHLANARKQQHIRTVNSVLGLSSPLIVTPLELVITEDEETL